MTGGNPLTDEELLLDSEAWEGDEDLFLPDGTAEVERLDADTVSYLQHADSSPLYEHFRVVADKGQAPMRIDKYLATRMTGSSRSRIQQALDGGYVFVGDKPVKSNYRIKPLDVVTLQLRRPKHELEIIPEPIPLDVVYEDEVLMVVNKPAGLGRPPRARQLYRHAGQCTGLLPARMTPSMIPPTPTSVSSIVSTRTRVACSSSPSVPKRRRIWHVSSSTRRPAAPTAPSSGED